MSKSVLDLVARRLNAVYGRWRVTGDVAIGPAGSAITASYGHHDPAHGEVSADHVDLGFVADQSRPDCPIVWDCTFIPRNSRIGARRMADAWVKTTGVTFLELLTQQGRFGTHYLADDPEGFAGWHAIHGGIIAIGRSRMERDLLQRWWLTHPLLPELRATIVPALDRQELIGVKVFFGSNGRESVAEVRVNGEAVPDACNALRELPWPLFPVPTFVRGFVLLVHEDP